MTENDIRKAKRIIYAFEAWDGGVFRADATQETFDDVDRLKERYQEVRRKGFREASDAAKIEFICQVISVA